MTHTVEFTAAANREYRKLPRGIQTSIRPAIDALADDPRPHGVEKLAGMDDTWRIRVGDYRIIYRILDDRLVVLVIRVGHRREVYR